MLLGNLERGASGSREQGGRSVPKAIWHKVGKTHRLCCWLEDAGTPSSQSCCLHGSPSFRRGQMRPPWRPDARRSARRSATTARGSWTVRLLPVFVVFVSPSLRALEINAVSPSTSSQESARVSMGRVPTYARNETSVASLSRSASISRARIASICAADAARGTRTMRLGWRRVRAGLRRISSIASARSRICDRSLDTFAMLAGPAPAWSRSCCH